METTTPEVIVYVEPNLQSSLDWRTQGRVGRKVKEIGAFTIFTLANGLSELVRAAPTYQLKIENFEEKP